MALIRAHIQLGIHPRCWKIARGVAIPKPGREDYDLANHIASSASSTASARWWRRWPPCWSAHTARQPAGSPGCRVRRSAVDAVGVAIAQTQEAWRRGRVTGALLMGVAAAFPSVARGCLLRKMRAMGINENLVDWTDSFMRDRRVIMSVDGQDDDPRPVTNGLPQGYPISPVLFAIYIADIHSAVEDQVEEPRHLLCRRRCLAG